ncbi:MAG: diguanylate cyclase [Pseudomonadota bacterium]|nr:diguanylate cyclase [Pseudomonadota bacterium]
MFFDVDRFKSIDDQYGHRTGDDTLRSIGLRTRNRLRTYDLFGAATAATRCWPCSPIPAWWKPWAWPRTSLGGELPAAGDQGLQAQREP